MKKTNFISKSIGAKLIVLFLIASILPLGIIGFISYQNSKKALMQSIISSITSITSSRASHIDDFIMVNLDYIKTVSSYKVIQENVLNITQGKDVQNSTQLIETELEKFNSSSNVFYRSKILNLNGIVIATTKSVLNDIGANKSEYEYFKKGLMGEYVSDPYISPELDVSNIAFSCPVFAPNSKNIIGVFVIHQGMEGTLNGGKNQGRGMGVEDITIHPEGMGNTGKTYLVNNDGLIISHPRLENNAFLKKSITRETLQNILSANYDFSYIDYRGIQVFGNAKPITDTNWYLVGEFDQSEILLPIIEMQKKMLLISLIIIVFVIIMAYSISRYFTTPIIKLSNLAKSMAMGDLGVPIQIKLTDEIGQLGESFKTMQKSMLEKARVAEEISKGNLTVENIVLSEKDIMGISFKTMSEKLRAQLIEIDESINVLSSSTSEIMASITQLASTSAESAASVSETTTTVEEVKQTAEVSNFKAREVSDKTTNTATISREGTKAIENTIEGMHTIQKQMNSIGNIVVGLSEQSQYISEITLTINELAEQSNILAVNAAIEAAKAGEQGKGFGVVAQEIKNLSERSKEANLQIRSIIKDIQKSISTAVMATEEGNKAVSNGLTLSAISGESIKTLSSSINDAANASLQIAASSQQQLEGVDQIAIAMENIKEASMQASSSTQQSAIAVRDIQEMAENLKKLMKQYKI